MSLPPANTSVWSALAANSVYCFEILLNPEGAPTRPSRRRPSADNPAPPSEPAPIPAEDRTSPISATTTGFVYDNLNLGLASSIRFRVARAAGSPEGRIEVRQDSITGPVLGSIAVPETGGWQTWETIEAALHPRGRPATGFSEIR